MFYICFQSSNLRAFSHLKSSLFYFIFYLRFFSISRIYLIGSIIADVNKHECWLNVSLNGKNGISFMGVYRINIIRSY